MWTPFIPRQQEWHLEVGDPSPSPSASDAAKYAYELRILNLLLPAVLFAPPQRVWKRESPDFEVTSTKGTLFVEIVDAVPDAVDANGTMNVGKRRSRENLTPYHVDPVQFAGAIAAVIEEKRRKARQWAITEPHLQGKLVLLVNAGQGPLWLRHYFRDEAALTQHIPLAEIDPFACVALGDETGAFLAR
jgi:hypothetical protein